MSVKDLFANSYWGKLFKRDKTLFVIIFLFFALSVFSNLIKLDTTPFYTYGFYAHKSPPQEDYTFYEVRYNNDRLLFLSHSWEQAHFVMDFDPLALYTTARVKGTTGQMGDYLENHWAPKHPRFRSVVPYLYPRSSAFDSFPGWYKRYLSQQTDEPVKDIYVLQKKVRFLESGYVEEITSDTALVIH